jgi:hypothetical protein
VVVALFLIEGYKKLSPDPGDRNAFYLRQISQQLASFADSDPSNTTFVPLLDHSPHPPTTTIVWANAVWVLSLVFSIMSGLFATLNQQWARRYLQLPHIPRTVSEQARVRSFLSFGANKYGIVSGMELTPMLLYFSILLFFAGLIIFFLIVYKTIAIVLSISVGAFAVVYLVCTILPCIDYHCPYHTPMSSVFWYTWQTFLSSVTLFPHWLLRLLIFYLVPYDLGDVMPFRQRILTRCLQTIDNFTEKHQRNLVDGFRRSIVQGALEAPELVDLKALTWLFGRAELAENSKIQEFVANIPGGTIIQLMSGPIESGRIVFRDRLLSLLRSCAPGTVGLDEDMRRRRLLVCLNAIHYIAKAFTFPYGSSPPEFVLSDLRVNFANIRLMRLLWADTDPSIRIISRSICALLATHLTRKLPLEESELAWLQDVVGKPSHTIFNALDNPSALDSMNIDAYVYGVLSRQTDDLSTRQARLFMSTLTILTNTGTDTVFRSSARTTTSGGATQAEGGISTLIERADEDNRLREIVVKPKRTFEAVFASNTSYQRISAISS